MNQQTQLTLRVPYSRNMRYAFFSVIAGEVRKIINQETIENDAKYAAHVQDIIKAASEAINSRGPMPHWFGTTVIFERGNETEGSTLTFRRP